MYQSFDEAETFTPIDSLKRSTMANGLILAIPLAVLTWVIVTIVVGAMGLPAPQLFGVVLSGAFMVVMWRVASDRLGAQIAAMTLTFDARGITQSDTIATRFVSWEGLRGGGMVKPVVAMSTGKLGRRGRGSRTAGVDALASTAAAKELGLVGIGTITLAPSVGVMQRETYKQNEGRNGVDPATGQPLVALYPQQFDLTWWDRRIGGWVQHFRPDVFAEAKALADERARISSTSMRQVWKDAKADAARQAEQSSGRTIP